MLRAAALSSRSASYACSEVLKRLQAAVAPSTWQQCACSCGTAFPQQLAYSTASGDDESSRGTNSSSSSSSSSSQASSVGVSFQQSHRQQSRTGYPQSVAVRAAGDTAADSGSTQPPQPPQLYREVLRVPLRAEEQQEAAEQQVDAYSLSRSLLGSSQQPSPQQAAAADAAGAPSAFGAAVSGGPARLTAADAAVLEKLVGILTRDGKKARARRILLDAMHIINRQVKGTQ